MHIVYILKKKKKKKKSEDVIVLLKCDADDFYIFYSTSEPYRALVHINLSYGFSQA